ncbi:hypothetical protein LKO27_03715 [Tessaracoccus sp. OS52]|uniref:hypothetical protein n=1 Tax=Tessaracoccus sp. OS52 TaxID=2886691 RepID=UPI001D11C21F|nr:hypothetical protein [Tessaracoccus sp. OS52]MCC2592527.1 hypothetical protein [Tessaracoccus sp. OS52]
MDDVTAPIDDLRQWARGAYPLEAAVELLGRAFGGRFAEPNNPWIRIGDAGHLWLDAELIIDATINRYSGGEQRVLRIVASLAGALPVALNEVLSGNDSEVTNLVFAAMSHAGGGHGGETVEHPRAIDSVNWGAPYPTP